jgi:hypothetical protein
MAAKISVAFTQRASVSGVADLYGIRDKVELQGLDPSKATEYASSALNEVLNGAESGSAATLCRITISIEPANSMADVSFPEIT